VGQIEEGKDKEVPIMKYNETTFVDYVRYLQLHLKSFVLHNYPVCWQDVQFKQQLDQLLTYAILTCVDFNENYIMKIQNEIQNMHWLNTHVSILVVITYKYNPSYDPILEKSKLLKEVHYFISDDKEHDMLYVQHCFMFFWEHTKQLGCFPLEHFIWSDGCSSQFKSSRAWFFVGRYPSLTSCAALLSCSQMTWNFFASGHGKGEMDVVRTFCKQKICKR
jgi:hypothetical protein